MASIAPAAQPVGSGAVPPASDADRPRALTTTTVDDVMSVVGSAVGALGVVWIIFYRLLPLSGALGFVICWYTVFLALYTGVTAMSHPRTAVVDRLARALITGAAGIVGLALVFTIVFTFVRGRHALLHLNFYTKDASGVSPTAPLNQGGILHAIVGTFIELAIATAISLPLGIGAAIYMSEVGGRLARVVRTVVEAMTALPDLVAGLFIYTTVIVALRFEKGGLTAALALAITMLPIIARTAEVQLRIVPGGLREASLALGSPKWRMVLQIVIPTAATGLATALILAFARAVGETAPVLIASGATPFLRFNPTGDPMNSLPLYIFTSVRTGEPLEIERAFGAACVLLTIVLLLFVALRLLARQKGTAR
ncbi:MAG TPA: phosphate ABC transporter permease PstA [Mycobacteriales bacterium]|nr:phosphate ABC transporter permease PstA [Mycobacteriales bacterium]